jgi:hypothetical protein
MGAVVQINPALPAAIKKLAALATIETPNELTGGVLGGFPVLSYKGKVWRIREGGQEEMYLDQNDNPMPFIEVVLVQANPTLSKIYYEGAFVEGSQEPPRCFSNQGDKPDASVQQPLSRTCAVCPKNVWGSKISDAGKKLKACQDSRRMAVVFADDLYNNAANVDAVKVLLLRVPPASLNVVKDYQEKVLGPKGLPFFGLVTRIQFDPSAAHPQFVLKPSRFINDDEAEAISKLRGSPRITRILAEAQEHPAASTESHGAGELTEATEEEEMAPAPPPKAAAQPAAAKPAKAVMRPANDEEAGAAVLEQPAATPKPAAKVNGKAPPVAAATPTKAAAKPAKAPPAAVEEAAPAGDNIDDMLDSILNG